MKSESSCIAYHYAHISDLFFADNIWIINRFVVVAVFISVLIHTTKFEFSCIEHHIVCIYPCVQFMYIIL